jgi:hypothetical protein
MIALINMCAGLTYLLRYVSLDSPRQRKQVVQNFYKELRRNKKNSEKSKHRMVRTFYERWEHEIIGRYARPTPKRSDIVNVRLIAWMASVTPNNDLLLPSTAHLSSPTPPPPLPPVAQPTARPRPLTPPAARHMTAELQRNPSTVVAPPSSPPPIAASYAAMVPPPCPGRLRWRQGP